MASWKKVLVSGQDLTDTTDLTGNTGQLGIGTGGGITLNGAVADVDGLRLLTSFLFTITALPHPKKPL